MNLEQLTNKNILLLGKTRVFQFGEFASLLKKNDIHLTENNFSIIVEGAMMTPYEQNRVDELYATHQYTFIAIDHLEKLLTQTIAHKPLLMSLKLSRNTQRLLSYIHNNYIDDTLFFDLLRIYNWDGEDFFATDTNRDVSASLIRRFYKNLHTNHNAEYAPSGLYTLAQQTTNTQLLETLATLQPTRNHIQLQCAIASNSCTPMHIVQRWIDTGSKELLNAIAKNRELDDDTLIQLIQKDDTLAFISAHHIQLSDKRFALLKTYHTIALNPTLTLQMQEQLFQTRNDAILNALATNKALTTPLAQKILSLKEAQLSALIYRNFCNDIALLQEAFDKGEHLEDLAHNHATPQEILQQLYTLQTPTILMALACNENTPIDLLYQLQLDRRFERYVKTNKSFGTFIQTQNIGWLDI